MASLGIFGLRSVTLGERSAGNTLEKQRSLRAAESAIGYGEWWLSRNNLGASVECTTAVNGNTVSLMRVCTNALVSPASLPWTGGTIYTPAAMSLSADAGLASSGDVNYQQPPQLYIHYLGANRRGTFYSVSGAGFGGNESTVSVLQSTFSFNLNSIDLGGL
ncbi:pilus assembly protein PilX [Comamonas odontotermitis]|uniref:pilus assembly PilX family protein n=1 Tax=Comamonas odontotermitis TaxID=379895 RepID=UPI00366D8F7E